MSSGRPRPVGIGVIGARSMVAELAVLPAIDASEQVRLIAASSRTGPRHPAAIASAVDTYDEVIDHPDVEVVYVPLPNGMHRTWVERIAAAGKHALCEKPLAPTVTDAAAMHQTCIDAGVLLAEAWMTPFDPRWAHTIELARSGLIGAVHHTDARFTFTIGPEAATNYRWDPTQGGGAILDVGIYCLGAAFELFGDHPSTVHIDRSMSTSGVDETATIEVAWPDGSAASAICSFVHDEAQTLTLTGTSGSLSLTNDAHTGGLAARTIDHRDCEGALHRIDVRPDDPYRRMIEAFARAVRGVEAWPRSIERSMLMLDALTSTPT